MDLGAYVQIEDLHEIAKKNGIEVPRLRGYRLMKDEEPITSIDEFYSNIELSVCKDLCCSIPFWSAHADCFEWSRYTDYIVEYYTNESSPRWDRIHGWKRRVLKTEIHNLRKRVKKQMDTFNKYVGREDILYIHARIGGGNWSSYYDKVVTQPWFIEKVDDCYDSTYCDIYAKINI